MNETSDLPLESGAPLGEVSTRSARGGALMIGAQAAHLLISIVTGMALARLLDPADFGIFAMVLSLTAFVTSFSDFGLGMAAVQRDGIDDSELSALFWLGVRLSGLTFLFMAMMAPVLVWFYDEPRLTGVTLVMALAVIILEFAVQQRAVLVRRMRFGTITAIEVSAALVGAAAGITAAAYGAAHWALVLQFLALAIAQTGGAWLFCGWRPMPLRDAGGSGFRALTVYGREYTLYRVVNHIGFNLDRVLVGYFRGATAMGLYDNSFRWSRYPMRQVFAPLLNVAVAGLSRLQSDAPAFRSAFRKGALPVYTIVLPALAFMAAEPRLVILVLLGPRWIEAIPLFRLLCAAAFASSLIQSTNWIYLSEGRTRRQFRWAFVHSTIMVIAVSIGVRWGALGVAAGFTAGTWLLVVPAIAFCLESSRLTMRDFLGAVWRPVAAAALGTTLLAGAPPMLPGARPIFALSAELALFAVTYSASWLALRGGVDAARELLQLRRTLGWTAARTRSRG